MNCVVDYGMGNIGSIVNMARNIGFEVRIVKNAMELKDANKIILPGVGSFDNAILKLKAIGLFDEIKHAVKDKNIKILGICLGMQILFNTSEEGIETGLSLIEGNVVKFDQKKMIDQKKVPNMGWNKVNTNCKSKLFNNLYFENRFYFVHSYHVVCNNVEDEIGYTNYGYKFTSAVEHENIYGVQFHPEKSHKFGKILLKNFLED